MQRLAGERATLSKALDASSPYHDANYRSLPYLVGKIARSTMLPR